MSRLRFFLLIFVFLAFLSTNSFAEPYIVSPDNLGVDAGWAQFSVKISTNKKVYSAGDALVATIRANRDCHILVYYTNENGSCLIVYPNSYEAKNHIGSGENFSIGNDPSVFSLIVDTPKVRDFLQVIATDEQIDVTALMGISDPVQFVDRVRLILKERVMQRKAELGNTANVPLNRKVFAIGTTDYLCNFSSYSESHLDNKPKPPTTPQGPAPVIAIRTVTVPEARNVRVIGPSAQSSCASSSNDVYSIDSGSALIMGTVSYGKGVKKILVNGEEPTIKRIGGKSITIEAADVEFHDNLDFQYIMKDISPTPREVVITSEGMDGKISKKVIRVIRK